MAHALKSAKARSRQICNEALIASKTDNRKEEEQKIRLMLARISSLLKKSKIDARPKVGGSAAKDTFLGNDFDIDIFVIFNYKKYLGKDISALLGKALKPLKPSMVMGSRNYYQIDRRFEIIPVLAIKSSGQIVNVTDASVLHVSWVNKHLKRMPKLKDEIRLAKLFFKGIGVYGAESYIKGISGHVTDILIIYYGSFEKFLSACAGWKEHVEIDIEKHKTVLDKAKTIGPLTVIDPIQPNRNAAAALSEEKFAHLKKKAGEFLRKPDIGYFIPRKLELLQLKDEYNFIVKAEPKQGKIDIVGAKLMKGYEFTKARIAEFGIKKSEWLWDRDKNCYYCFLLEKFELSSKFERRGPSKELPIHVKRFREIYKNAYLREGVWYAKVERDKTSIEQFFNWLSKDGYMLDKAKCISIVHKA